MNKKIPVYNHKDIEAKWQIHWEENQKFKAENNSSKPKYYPLVEFPFPSGAGLHVGHLRPYTAMDVVARKKRLEGYNVLFTMGWDAFGLPAENYAIKNKIHPSIVTKENIANYKNQLSKLGLSFDWSREVDTTDPNYFKWTQWIFIKLFEHGLAYKNEMMINWCPSCKIGLANEEATGGECERCGGKVEQKLKLQWMLKITDYAQKLLDGLEEVDFVERVKTQQRNWIGKSEGAEIIFPTTTGDSIKVYTTRPDTIYGATYMVMSPEHPYIKKWSSQLKNMDAINSYIEQAHKKTDFERFELAKEKTGVRLEGVNAINPITKKEISIWISDYVLMSYGSGAIMSVPAHDTRDFEFATKFDLPIIQVVEPENVTQSIENDKAYEAQTGVLINSPLINNLKVRDAKNKIISYIEENKIGERKTNFKLRDWVFSRQRYWGEPIPLVNCKTHGWVAIPESELPLRLPNIEKYEPTGTGESPLAAMEDWVQTTCPICGGVARRETDTMPQWAGSSWYYLRYCDPQNKNMLASPEALKYWLEVDWYNGGMEHTTLHLLYSRFWHRFLYDIGLVPTPEPYKKRTSHGMILAKDGEKMSKSRNNVVNPDDYIESVGTDTLRTFEMFMGDFEKAIPWCEDDSSIHGIRKFLDRVWALQELVSHDPADELGEYACELETIMHQTIKKVTNDYDMLKFNTAIAQLMTMMNKIRSVGKLDRKSYRSYLLLLNPVAPHITEEIWQNMGFGGELADAVWPSYDEAKTIDPKYELPISINGKFKLTLEFDDGEDQKNIEKAVMAEPRIATAIESKKIVKIIYVEKKILNIIVK